MNQKQYIENLRSRLNVVREELNALHEQASSIIREMESKQQLVHHLSRLLTVEGYEAYEDDLEELGPLTRPVDLAFEYMDQQDGHSVVHYRELTSILISRGAIIAGKDPAANLLTQMSKDSRFVRVAPGKYGLTKWRMKKNVSARSRRKKKKS